MPWHCDGLCFWKIYSGETRNSRSSLLINGNLRAIGIHDQGHIIRIGCTALLHPAVAIVQKLSSMPPRNHRTENRRMTGHTLAHGFNATKLTSAKCSVKLECNIVNGICSRYCGDAPPMNQFNTIDERRSRMAWHSLRTMQSNYCNVVQRTIPLHFRGQRRWLWTNSMWTGCSLQSNPSTKWSH